MRLRDTDCNFYLGSYNIQNPSCYKNYSTGYENYRLVINIERQVMDIGQHKPYRKLHTHTKMDIVTSRTVAGSTKMQKPRYVHVITTTRNLHLSLPSLDE